MVILEKSEKWVQFSILYHISTLKDLAKDSIIILLVEMWLHFIDLLSKVFLCLYVKLISSKNTALTLTST